VDRFQKKVLKSKEMQATKAAAITKKKQPVTA
jgi:hypothetical protein